MRIAIIEDNLRDRALIRGQLEQEAVLRGLSVQLEEYESGEGFLAQFSPGAFAAVFVDIYLGEVSGVEVASRLYQEDPDCRIVFLSNSDEYLRESYAVRATYYLVKPYTLSQLRQALDFCFPETDTADILTVRTRKGMTLIPRQDILYIEAEGRYPFVHLKDRQIESLDKFSVLVSSLEDDPRFFPCCRGIVVHLGKISAMEKSDFILQNGQRVPISQRSRTQARRAFHSFVFRGIREESQ